MKPANAPDNRAGKTPLAGRAAVWLLGLGLVAFVYVLFSATSKPETSGLARFANGAMATLVVPDEPQEQTRRTFEDASGAPRRLSDYAGEVVVVNFWAINCAPCRVEMPSLAALAERFEGREVRVIAISQDELSDKQKARELLSELSDGRLDFYFDHTRGVALDSRAGGMPTTIIYDRSGAEAARLTGDADWASAEAAALIEAVLAEG